MRALLRPKPGRYQIGVWVQGARARHTPRSPGSFSRLARLGSVLQQQRPRGGPRGRRPAISWPRFELRNFGGRYWARTSDPQLVDSEQRSSPFAHVRERCVVERDLAASERPSERERTLSVAIVAKLGGRNPAGKLAQFARAGKKRRRGRRGNAHAVSELRACLLTTRQTMSLSRG